MDREHRFFTHRPRRSRGAKSPVPVLLFGVTTLRIICIDTGASEWPPAGPEKYSYTLGFDHGDQIFRFLSSSKNIMFETKISKFGAHGKSLLVFP